MKRMYWMAITALVLLTAISASAQSLGDVARSNRKGKTQTTAANHKYDNDNLPTNEHLSVVGPASTATSSPAAATEASVQPQTDSAAGAPPVAPSRQHWFNQ